MMRLWIVEANKETETNLAVYLSDGSLVEVTLDDLLWLRSQKIPDSPAEINPAKWD
jgi:hypothetical protein